MNSFQQFVQGRIPFNIIVSADAYTICGDCLVSDRAKKFSQYYIANRYSPQKVWSVAKDSRMVLWGLSDFIRNYLTKPITIHDINAAECFMSQAHITGNPLKFNREIWETILYKYDGYLPIKIEALPECSTFFPNEPVIVVSNSAPGYGEIAAHVEALLLGMVSIGSAAVTLRRHWLERIIEWMKLSNNPDKYSIAQGMIHDFGMRASSCAEESELLGKAHLLVFKGTDTFNAAYQAWNNGCNKSTGKSILALAHRSIMGYDTEEECYNNIIDQDFIGSYVADCYNFKNAVENILIPLALKNHDKVIVIRPDSGDSIENTRIVINAWKNAGSPVNVRLIHGDSINPQSMEDIINVCWDNGINPKDFIVFGIGGYLRNNVTRDSLSSSYKLSCIASEKALELTPSVKLSDTQTKLSVPGPNYLVRHNGDMTTVKYGYSNKDCRVTYYDGSQRDLELKFLSPCYEQFSKLENRCINQFNEMGRYPYDFGLASNTCLSEDIRNIQKMFYEKYKGKENGRD